ncbi:hypothetical protein EDF46_1452 [Frondihabitans sp. PhB188]|uniref:hypothetical protein n=1 Tax=Frondihabitans sp. PhB188 TaxID=2485200 RepID=UPI000F4A5AFD|nr:hypothetical protein [Frondihabitans sp. PhB188]ROQ39817.1 hypothetical protein EDF46_1452 [Frondihabitans sp. PhB188]
MRTASPSNSDRSRFTALELELAAILWAWDPVGVAPGRTDDGEYDDLVRPILIELGHGVRDTALAVKIAGAMSTDYGLAMREQQARGVAATITEWWAAQP